MLQLLAGKDTGEREGSVRFKRYRPEQTLLYRLIEQYYPDFELQWASEGRGLPDYVRREFDEYLKCGRLEHGFLRVQCKSCHAEHLVAFSCKRRGFCPSCGARRMVESAALLVDEVFPQQAVRQWVLSVPFPLRFLFASQPKIMGKALGIVYRTIATHLTHKAGHKKSTAHTGAVTLIQRFGSALNLNNHFHGARPCAPPCGRPAVVQIGNPADLSHAVSRWCVCGRSRFSPVSLGKSTNQR